MYMSLFTSILFRNSNSRWLAGVLLWLLGGLGPAYGQSIAPFVVRVTPTAPPTLNAGQSQLLTAQTVYPALNAGTGFSTPPVSTNCYVQTFVVQPDGMVLVGGNFTNYDGTTRNYVSRLNANGVLDTSFGPATGGLDNVVTAIGLQPDGKILVAGDFSGFIDNQGVLQNRKYLARLEANGTIDLSFGANGQVLTNSSTGFVVQPNNKILVVGNAPPYVNRLNADGGRDASFLPNGAGYAGFDGYTNAVALQPDGRILVGGTFTHYNGVARNGLARLEADGSLDTSFNPTGTGVAANVRTLVLQPDGKVLVGGEFPNRLVRLNANSSLDTNFPATGTALSDPILSLALQPDGKVLAGDAQGRLFRFNAAGSLDNSFVSSASTGVFFNDYVNSLVVQPNGKVLAGGIFTQYGGATTTNRIARLTATGKLDNTDTPVAGATYVWSNGSTGPTLTVNTANTYSATATLNGQTATSNAVAVTVNGATSGSFTVRVTPAGPFNICPNTTQTITAAAQGATQPATYTWWQVGNSQSVGTGPSYTVGSPGQYFATALAGGATVASPSVTVNTLPTPAILTNSVRGLPGTNVVLAGANFQVVTGVSFGGLNATFVLDSPTQLTVTVPAGATSGDISLATACSNFSFANRFRVPTPTITSFTPSGGVPGTLVTLTGTDFVVGATAVSFYNVLNPTTPTVTVAGAVSSSTTLTVFVPGSASGTGPLTVTTVGGSYTSATPFSTFLPLGPTPVTVTGPTTIYTTGTSTASDDLIIKAPGHVTIMRNPALPPSTANTIAINNIEVQTGATLTIVDDARVTGNGTFSLAAGATLNVGHQNGLNLTGAVSFGQNMLFSPDASYGYTGTTAQVTGSYLPRRVRNLTSANTTGLSLTNPVSIAQVLTMAGAGNLNLNNQMLTLLSGAGGTALVNNQGAGVVVGTATVHRYIDPSINPTAGFRYYGSPVRGAQATTFRVPAFAYDQQRSLSFARRDTVPDISYGFVPTPLASSTFLEVGRGYRAAVPAADTVRFVGMLNTGNDTVNIQRSSAKSYSGWNLVSNPYPSPLNWNKVDPADRPGLEAAIYVYESTGPGTGYFRNYVYKKVGTGDSLIASGQAFFVRVSKNSAGPINTGKLIFRNSQRVTTFDSLTQPTFNRTARAVEAELDIEFARDKGCRPCRPTSMAATAAAQALSSVKIYTNAAATPAFDPQLDADAGNLINANQRTLGIRVGNSTHSTSADTLAVQALPPFPATGTTRVLLALGATAPGVYTLNGTGQNLSTMLNGTTAYLRDSSATTNNWILLPTPTPYAFVLSAAELLATTKPTRFWLHFSPSIPTATIGSAALQSASVYPNPAHEQFSVRVPAVAGATAVQATLLSSMGQVVLRQEAALPASGATLNLSGPGLASGVYILRLQAGDITTTRRVVLID